MWSCPCGRRAPRAGTRSSSPRSSPAIRWSASHCPESEPGAQFFRPGAHPRHELFHSVAEGRAADRNRRHAPTAELGVKPVGVEGADGGARIERDAEGNRARRAVWHPVRRGEWDVTREPRAEIECASPALEFVAPAEVAVGPGQEALKV